MAALALARDFQNREDGAIVARASGPMKYKPAEEDHDEFVQASSRLDLQSHLFF